MDQVLFALQMALAGVGVGLISNVAGLGGGILMVPAFMTIVPGMDAHTAKGTSLFIIIFVALLNSWRIWHGEPQKPWRLAGQIALGAVVGSYLGAWVTTLLPEPVIIILFLVLMGFVGARLLFVQPPEATTSSVSRSYLLPSLIGFLAGLAGGATGTGGGSVIVPLCLLWGLSTNREVVGLSNLVMIATSLAGSVAHLAATPVYGAPWTVGHVYLAIAPLVLLGAQAIAPLGRALNRRLSLGWRRAILLALMIAIAVRLLWQLIP